MANKQVQFAVCSKWFSNAVTWQAHKALTGH
jgi:hypothetical protein